MTVQFEPRIRGARLAFLESWRGALDGRAPRQAIELDGGAVSGRYVLVPAKFTQDAAPLRRSDEPPRPQRSGPHLQPDRCLERHC